MLDWSFPLYRAFGIQVRSHWIFPIFLAIEFYKGREWLDYTAITMLILFTQVLTHEYGHSFTAIRLGAGCDRIVLWPLGGASYCGRSSSARDDLWITFMGPAVNSFFFFAGLLALWALGHLTWTTLHPWEGWYLFWPGAGRSQAECYALNALVVSTKLGMILTAFNLFVPAYPLDGGRMLLTWLSSRHGRDRAARISTMVAIPIGILLAVFGMLKRPEPDFLLFLIGAMVIFDNYQMRKMAEAGALDQHPAFPPEAEWASLRYREEPERRPGWFARWRMRKREAEKREHHQQRAVLEAQVDQILAKVSREGIGSLTPDERRVLDEASRQKRGS